MSRVNWEERLALFAETWSRTGISPKAWSDEQGYSWGTAKAYISIKAAKALLSGDVEKVANSGKKSRKKTPNKIANSRNESAKSCEIKKSEASSYFDARPPESEEKKSQDYFPALSLNPDEFGLSEKEGIFAEEVARGAKLIEAYRKAKYSDDPKTAYAQASKMVRKHNISRAIRWLRDKRQKRYTAELDELVHQLMAIANADPNVLTQHRRNNCRYCWGENHLYQWRDIQEFDCAAALNAKDGKAEPEYGGLGFVDSTLPNPECPKCSGEGVGQVHFADTSLIDGDERWLYAGVKQTKDGLQLMMHDQDSARRTLLNLLTRSDLLRKGPENIPSGFGDFYDDNIPTEPQPCVKKLLDDEGEE
ncbi:terminase small subunit [Enterobacter cancerogenus]